MIDHQLEDHEAIVSWLPSRSGDGYSYGGGAIVSIGPYALHLGEGQNDFELAKEIAARWNEMRGKRVRPEVSF